MLLCHDQLSHLVVWSLVLPFLTCSFFWLLYPITSHDPCVSSSSLLNICLSYHSVSVRDDVVGRKCLINLWRLKQKSNPTSKVKLPQFTSRHTDTQLKGAWCGKAMRDHRRKYLSIVPKRKGKAGQEDGERLRVPGFDSSLQLLNSQMGYQNVAENLRLL